jgi:hypothetical protein
MTQQEIIERFNQSILEFKNGVSLAKENIFLAQEHLINSGTYVYQSVEWFAKIELKKYYFDSEAHPTEIRTIDGTQFQPKIVLLKKTLIPSPQNAGIDLDVILDFKNVARNAPEHSGFVPNCKSLFRVLLEARKLFIQYSKTPENILEIDLDPSLENEIHKNNENWEKLILACDSFSDKRNYILITGEKTEFNPQKIPTLGLLFWSLVFDFNSKTENSGLFKFLKPRLEKNANIHLLTLNDNVNTISPNNSIFYIASNGLEGRSNTTFLDPKEWNKKYSSYLQKAINCYHDGLGGKPSTAIIFNNDKEQVRKLCELLYNTFDKSIDFIFTYSNTDSTLTEIREFYEGKNIPISTNEFCEGLVKTQNFFNFNLLEDTIYIPEKNSGTIEIEKTKYLWLKEDFDLLHINILNESSFDVKDRDNFLRGHEISWHGLNQRFDILRDITSNIRKKTEKLLRDRGAEKITISHYPGIGGSTIARRIGWDLRENNPVIFLNRYKQTETIDRIFFLFNLSSLPPLIICESNKINNDSIDRLFNEVKTRNFPAIILKVQRKDDVKKPSTNEFYISEALSDNELTSFVNAYSEIKPEKTIQINELKNQKESKLKHPFYFGLTAFEENFNGLANFIHQALINATETQKKILTFISISYYYSQQSFNAQLLSRFLGLNESSIVKLDDFLSKEQLHLLINDEVLCWRPLHQLIAKEIIIQILGKGNPNIWKQHLTEYAIEIIELFGNQTNYLSDNEFEQLRRLFIYRDDEELLGKESDRNFSRIIQEGIINDSARLRVFIALTEKFPNESHFWAHLARFYSVIMENYEEAILAINKAIGLSDKDSLLYHMKGMCLRAQANSLIRNNMNVKTCSIEIRNRIISLVELCGVEFEESRRINPFNEHGYISHIQILLNALDFAYSISNFESRADFIKNLSNRHYFDFLCLAEELIEKIKRLRKDQDDNYYITQCNAQLNNFFENYSSIIQGWNNLLVNSNIDHNKIRTQLVRVYVKRAKNWESVDQKDLEKMLSLLNENLENDPTNNESILLWLQTVRLLKSYDINKVIEKVSNWNINTENLDSLYYLSILHTVQAIGGFSSSKLIAEKLVRECSEKSRNLPNRSYCNEWYGSGDGLKKIVPSKKALFKNDDHELKFHSENLGILKGKVKFIKGPETGEIELESGLIVNFIPARANKGIGLAKSSDINAPVNFYLGFSYDGLKAWNVTTID